MLHVLVIGALLASLAHSHTITGPLPEQPSFRGNGTILDLPLLRYNWGTGSYFLSSALGTPPQPLNLTLVFNANGLVVPSVECVPTTGWDRCQQEAAPFNASASSTFVNITSTPAPLNVDSTPSGQAYLGSDSFTALGTGTSENYAVASQELALATEAGGIFYYDGSQGLFGLGVESSNLSSTLIGNRLENGSLPFFTVGIDLDPPDISHRTSSGGVLNWGGVDLDGRSSSSNSGSLTWVPSPPDFDGWWIPLDGMTVSGEALSLGAAGTTQMARLEPWSNSLVLPASVTSQIFGPLLSSFTAVDNYWLVPCDQFYNVSFTIGGTQFDLDSHEFVSHFNESTCRSSIMTWSDQATENIYQLGAPFLRAVYTALHVYRSDSNSSSLNKVVGFSQKPVTFAPPDLNTPPKSSSHVGAIAGGIIGGIVLLLSLSLLVLFLCLSRRKRRRDEAPRPSDPTTSYSGPLNAKFAAAQSGEDSSPLPSFSPAPTTAGASNLTRQGGVNVDGGGWEGREMSGVPVGGGGAPVGRDGRVVPELG